MDLPLEYRVKDDANAQGAILMRCEWKVGFSVSFYRRYDSSVRNWISLSVLREYELTKLEAFAEIVWKREDLGETGYRYGLKSIQIQDYERLKNSSMTLL